MKLITNVEFEIGQFVYLITDPDQVKFIVTAIKIESNCVLYEIAAGFSRAYVSPIEISDSKSVEFM